MVGELGNRKERFVGLDEGVKGLVVRTNGDGDFPIFCGGYNNGKRVECPYGAVRVVTSQGEDGWLRKNHPAYANFHSEAKRFSQHSTGMCPDCFSKFMRYIEESSGGFK